MNYLSEYVDIADQVITEIFDPVATESIANAYSLLSEGKLVAFPTETVYGLGANGLDPLAVEKIFLAKGRPSDNPLILHVASLDQALPLWQVNSKELQLARKLADIFWPGPLSLVLPSSNRVPSLVTAGLDSVAVRAPANAVARKLLNACPFPLAAPSANLSGRPSPTRAEHVTTTLDGRIAAILDGGPTQIGIESTVLDIRKAQPRLLRPGSLSRPALEAVIGKIIQSFDSTEPSPGLRHNHYQPRGVKLRLVNSEAIKAAWSQSNSILCRQTTGNRLGSRSGPLLLLPDSASDFAAALYNAFYSLEDLGVELCLIEQVPKSPEWRAIQDRLERATAD